jgi:hypothetical protein
MAKISGLVWAEFSHEQLVSWQFSMGKSDRLLVSQKEKGVKQLSLTPCFYGGVQFTTERLAIGTSE